MNSTFPAGFPLPTAFYLTLFVVTLALHVLFMNYVVAGSAWLFWSLVRGRIRPGKPGLPAGAPASCDSVVADWLPAMLSGAITAGVAPLLFVQILYQQGFYTANLLLFHRWMSILPVLIAGFYALYVLRTEWLGRRSRAVQVAMSMIPLVCVLFVAWSWTENHLLSLKGRGQWHAFYLAGRMVHFEAALWPRLAVWMAGSFATLAAWLAWQLRHRVVLGLAVEEHTASRLARTALAGLAVAGLGGVAAAALDRQSILTAFGPAARLYTGLAVAGVMLQVWGWLAIRRAGELGARHLIPVTIGLVLTIGGMTVLREVVRLETLGPERLALLIPQHASAWQVGGFPAFLLFAAINAGLIAWCFRLVATRRKPNAARS